MMVTNNCDGPLRDSGSESTETAFFDLNCLEVSTTDSDGTGGVHGRLLLSQRCARTKWVKPSLSPK